MFACFYPQEKLVLCSLYLIFGLALLAMCFDLMQEEARSLFRAAAIRMGLAPTPPPGGAGAGREDIGLGNPLPRRQWRI